MLGTRSPWSSPSPGSRRWIGRPVFHFPESDRSIQRSRRRPADRRPARRPAKLRITSCALPSHRDRLWPGKSWRIRAFRRPSRAPGDPWLDEEPKKSLRWERTGARGHFSQLAKLGDDDTVHEPAPSSQKHGVLRFSINENTFMRLRKFPEPQSAVVISGEDAVFGEVRQGRSRQAPELAGRPPPIR